MRRRRARRARRPAASGRGQAVDPLGDARQAVGAVVHGVHGGHDRQQHLGGADVGGGLLPADVLLAGLQGQAAGPGRPAASTDTPDEAAGHGRGWAASRTARKPACGPPKPRGTPKRWAEPTTTSAPHSPGGVQQGEGQQVGGHDDEGARARGPARRPGGRSRHRAGRCPGTATSTPKRSVPSRSGAGSPTTTSRPSGSARVGHHLDGLRVAVGVDEERGRGAPWLTPGTGPWPRPPRWPRRAARRWPGPCR